jgi:hypothetical protein
MPSGPPLSIISSTSITIALITAITTNGVVRVNHFLSITNVTKNTTSGAEEKALFLEVSEHSNNI